ncbi:metal-dependent amidase/aminoacylase/carboxypeptidase family protein [Rhizobium petrolearium]|uniref:hypothetical protein n=1 Tax=Neorhizobium petrolearium TaxID=515361 RepID=UPI001AE80C8C|nr:hypothetical protein [Neorhizobium petrolearium]MBP1848099.1 metal-dependent amidase/aminoacylase/carboxypeptidase family protein [Neorhizobium petrolearium]
MPVIERIAAYARELTAIRHDRHQYPEIGFALSPNCSAAGASMFIATSAKSA